MPEEALIARVVHADRRGDRRACAGPRGGRLQHRLDAGARRNCARASRCRSSAPCRRSSRPARIEHQARRRARHAGDRRPRIYPRADPRIRRRLRRHAGRLAASSRLRRGRAGRRAGRRRRDRGRDRAAASSRRTAAAPTPWCWPARIIRCCSTRFRAVAPWPVEWLDPAPAIARRVADLLRDVPAGGKRAAAAHRVHLGPRALARAGRGASEIRLLSCMTPRAACTSSAPRQIMSQAT